jgi:DNA replication licensing factor MCM3
MDRYKLFSCSCHDSVLGSPIDFVPPFEKALKDIILTLHPDPLSIEQDVFHVGFQGSFGDYAVSPLSLSPAHLGNMVCIEGIVTKCN